MTLAFNILVPRGRAWWVLLLVGNLTVFFSSETLKPPGRESFRLEGPRELRMVEATGRALEAVFSEQEWYLPERSRFDYWRWSRGPADVVLRNPHPFTVQADIAFDNKKLEAETAQKQQKLIADEQMKAAELTHDINVLTLEQQHEQQRQQLQAQQQQQLQAQQAQQEQAAQMQQPQPQQGV
jgi:hypothetical protein